jgi:hypothetical protein
VNFRVRAGGYPKRASPPDSQKGPEDLKDAAGPWRRPARRLTKRGAPSLANTIPANVERHLKQILRLRPTIQKKLRFGQVADGQHWFKRPEFRGRRRKRSSDHPNGLEYGQDRRQRGTSRRRGCLPQRHLSRLSAHRLVASLFDHGDAVLKARSMGRGIGGLGSNVGPPRTFQNTIQRDITRSGAAWCPPRVSGATCCWVWNSQWQIRRNYP